MSERMKIERATKVVAGALNLSDPEMLEAWSVVCDYATERGQYPQTNRRDGALDMETYRAKVRHA